MKPKNVFKILLLALFVLAALFCAAKTLWGNNKKIPVQPTVVKAEDDIEVLQAGTWYQMGRFHFAEMAYVSTSVRHPDSMVLWFNLGNTYFKQGKYKEAVQAYQKAAALELNNEDVQFNLKLAQRMLEPKKKGHNEKPADKDAVKELKPKQRNFLERFCDIFRL